MLLLWGGVALGASAGNPPAGAFSGDYKLTVRATNAKVGPWRWIYGARPRCSGPCHAVAFRTRLVSEKSWRKGVVKFRWNGKAYSYSKTAPKLADCRGKSDSAVKKGYDVTSSLKFQVRAVTHGRVTRWSGTGKDSYVPNVAGRKHHCTAGEYDYTLRGVAQ